jgi:tRNA-binding EMAP/Myf-like protein
MVVVVTNLKPRAVKGFESAGMVLCAVSGDTTEPILPPPGSEPGDRVTIQNHPPVECPVLPGKKWENSAKVLRVGPSNACLYDGNILETTKGPVKTSTLNEGVIK